MKVLVTGAKGQLGYDVVKELQKRQIECCGVDIEDFDITDYQATAKYIMEYKPEAIIHCSAYTAVDKAEDEQELCHKVNVIGTENIAKCCRELDAKMIYISTDYVFPGNGDSFYEVDEHKRDPYWCDDITYYMWELDFGKKWAPGMVTFEDKDIPLRNSSDLWELICSNLEE